MIEGCGHVGCDQGLICEMGGSILCRRFGALVALLRSVERFWAPYLSLRVMGTRSGLATMWVMEELDAL